MTCHFRCPECTTRWVVTPDTEGAPFACLDCSWRGPCTPLERP